MDNYQQKHCQQCGKELTGRTDKRFCDSYCRNTFNNQNKSEGEKVIAETHIILRRNRKILRQLSPMGKATVRKEVLDTLGYDYRFFTGIYRSRQGKYYYVCYDFAFSPINDDRGVKKVIIVQRQSYFDQYIPALWGKS
ncbi:hypothetical protein FNH22_17910 [Fulvivirga sp. M361]|uniref:hypothetical protein n=1 Tax=Fulvivirga sp. M361 TaxID=2594266 RepID=UPI00117A32D4|nr:hypothetical protein [Fulvivirga sp. M361]TRX55513.1 hypothetical protein FNH22_17910 [Fulvivirga sp. M361]